VQVDVLDAFCGGNLVSRRRVVRSQQPQPEGGPVLQALGAFPGVAFRYSWNAPAGLTRATDTATLSPRIGRIDGG
jgi:hypothetical protein